MKRVVITDVHAGAVLGASVFSERDRPLVAAGVAVSTASLQRIAAGGYSRLVLLETDEEPRPELILPEARAAILLALRSSVAHLLDAWRSDTPPQSTDAWHFDLALRQAVVEFVATIRCEAALTLPGPVRRGPAQWFDDAINAAALAVYLGRSFELDEPTLQRLAHGMLLRDAGMLALPQDLLARPGEFSPEEKLVVRQHAQRAYDALCALNWMDETARLVVLQHHERHDGSGYPQGISGLHTAGRTLRQTLDHDLTLLVVDVAAVCDVFNALTVDRPHRVSRSPRLVRSMLEAMAGGKLNREVVTALLEHWEPPQEDPVASLAG